MQASRSRQRQSTRSFAPTGPDRGGRTNPPGDLARAYAREAPPKPGPPPTLAVGVISPSLHTLAVWTNGAAGGGGEVTAMKTPVATCSCSDVRCSGTVSSGGGENPTHGRQPIDPEASHRTTLRDIDRARYRLRWATGARRATTVVHPPRPNQTPVVLTPRPKRTRRRSERRSSPKTVPTPILGRRQCNDAAAHPLMAFPTQPARIRLRSVRQAGHDTRPHAPSTGGRSDPK